MNFRHLLSTIGALLALLGASRGEQVVFSELMYVPASGKPEFIEVSNLTATPLDTARWKFSNGISFSFPDFNAGNPQAHFLQPFERILISAATPAATRAAYPGIPVATRILGPWTGALANEGERVTLEDKNGVIVCTVEYGDSGRWPVAPDGAGHSLVLATESKAIDDWRVWRSSTQNGGSPGVADPAPPAASLMLNEIHFGPTGNVDWIEIRNDSRVTSASAASFSLASKNDLSDKVALSGSLTPGAVASFNVDFAPNGDGEVKLYLVSGTNQVRDAVRITKKLGRDFWQRFPAESREWFNGPEGTRDAQNAPARNTDIVINEIMADPPSNQRDGEFVELYNRGAQPVSVGGWKLKEGVNFTIPPGTVIQPGGYLVIGANAAWLNATYPGVAAIGNWDGQLANSGEMLKLDDENGNLVNAVDYRFGGEWPELAAGNGSSLELANPNTDNSIGGAWRDSDESQKSTFQSFTVNGGTYLRSSAGGNLDDEIRIWAVGDSHIILKDLVLRPTGGGANLLVNPGVTTLNNNNVEGWQSRGTHADTFHDAEGIHLVADGHGDNKCNHMEKDAAGMNGGTAYTLEFQARWVWGKPRLVTQTWDTSWGGLALLPIPSNLGTPGAANSQLAANPAAQVTGLRHSPAVPLTGQAVTVTARVSSLTPIQTVQLRHRLDTLGGNGAWNTTTMTDNGSSGDAVANDGIYSVQINPAAFSGYSSSSAIVEFYVLVTASNGATSVLPRRGDAGPGLWAVGTPGPSDLRRMRIVMSAYWLNALDQNSGSGGHTANYNYKYPRLSARYFPCTFIHNDSEIYYDSKCRKTGSPWTRQTDNALSRGRVVLPGDNPFRGKTKMYWDNDGGATMLHNRITRYWLYLFGVPGNENEVCRVARNGGGYTVRETSEVFDKEMLDRIWENGSDGAFFEMDDKFWIGDDGATRLANQDGSWQYKANDSQGADNPTAYHNQFTPKSRETEYDYSGFIEFTRQLTTNPNMGFDLLEKMADSRTMTAYAAVRGYIGDWDTITGRRGKNGYMYQRATDHKWTFLHWDSDLAFQNTSEQVLGTIANIPTYFNRHPNRRQLNYFLMEIMNAYSANGSRLGAWLDAEENASNSYVANKSFYQSWSSGRAGAIQSYLGAAFFAPFSASSPPQNSTTSAATINITGTAPASGYTVECVGQPQATLNWNSESNWTISGIILKEGANALQFRMLDMFGDQVGSTYVHTINKTGNAAPIVALASNPASGNVGLGEILTLDASGSFDPEAAGNLSYAWSVSPSSGVTVSSPSDSTRKLVFHQPGNYTVTVEVTDADAQSASLSRAFSVFSAPEFDSFGGDYLEGYTVENAELRDNYSPSAWYSLNETDGHLVVQSLDDAPHPLTHSAPTFPLITRPLPESADFVLQTDLTLETRQFGSFLAGLWLETIESGVPVRYAFALENGANFKVFRSFNGASYSAQPSTNSGYAGGPITLRVMRQSGVLEFQRLLDGAWVPVLATPRPFPAGHTAVKGGVFVSTGSAFPATAQSARVAFDYLLIGNPANSSDLVSNLRLSEIMYNPGPGGVEYLELQNIGTTPLDLAGAYFESSQPWDTRFTFPSLVLDPGGFCIVTNDVAGFQALYGDSVAIAGPATGNLANSSERIVLKDANSNTVFDFTYVDTWHPATDGAGKSLDVLTSDQTLYGEASAWRPSYVDGGSAGYIDVPASIDSDPEGSTINPGQPINLQVTFTGAPLPTFQWRRNGEPIPGANSASYQVASATEDHEGSYEVFIENASGSDTSAVAVISVNDPVVFNPHPVSQAVNPGIDAIFTVGATGTGTLSYQWRKGGQNLEGENGTTLVVPGLEANEGVYDVVVTNVVGPETSNPATLSVNDPVVIITSPQSQTVNPGDLVTFSVTVSGTAPFSYQWRKNGEPLDGQDGQELEFVAEEGDEGAYSVLVNNMVNAVPSAEATLSVNDPVEITDQPEGGAVVLGQPFQLSVAATGTAPIDYQWWIGDDMIEGATSATYSVGIASAADFGTYRVVVTNPASSETSDPAIVSPVVPVQITADPAPQVVLPGGTASFTVEVSGTGPFGYQWRRGGTPIDGANEQTYQIPVVGTGDAGLYDVVVTNAGGSDISAQVALSLLDWKLAAGRYQGSLIGPNPAAPASDPFPGRVTVNITRTGRFSGILEHFGVKHPFRGSFGVNLKSSVSVKRRGLSPVALEVTLDGAAQRLDVTTAHTVTPPAFDYSGALAFIPKLARGTSSPLAGRYTMFVQPGDGAPADLTAPGVASVEVGNNGSVTWAGKLPDGSNLRGNAWLTPAGTLAFYSPLYVPRLPQAGHLAGPLELTADEITGPLAWRKPPQTRGAHWPGGFAMLAAAEGSRYTPPGRGAQIISASTPRLTLNGPIFGDTFTRLITMTPRNTFQVLAPNLERVRLSVNRNTGVVTGSYYDQIPRATRRLHGVIVQEENRAAGFFQGASTAGIWELVQE